MGKPVTGDWLVIHSLSDPEQLNPLTSSDASSSEVLNYIFEALLTRNPQTLELKPAIAEARPEISQRQAHLHFQDSPRCALSGRPAGHRGGCAFQRQGDQMSVRQRAVSARLFQFLDRRRAGRSVHDPFCHQGALFSQRKRARRHHPAAAPLLRSGKSFAADQRADSSPQDPAKLPAEAKKFGEQFNRNFNRNPLGSGPYKFNHWKTGREIELTRDPNYWGNGKEGIDQPHLDRLKFRIVNNMDAALTLLKSGSLDYMEVLTAGAGGARHQQRALQARIQKIRILRADLHLHRLEQRPSDFSRQKSSPGDDLPDRSEADRPKRALRSRRSGRQHIFIFSGPSTTRI